MGKTTRNKKSSNYKPLIILFIVLIAIVVASIAIGYFLSKGESEAGPNTIEQKELLDNTALESIKTPLEGTWISNYDGAILTINGLTFNLDLPSVDQSITIKGILSVEQNLVTFNSNSDKICKNMEGHYQYSFSADEVLFKLIKDNCNSRKERMTMSWFKL